MRLIIAGFLAALGLPAAALAQPESAGDASAATSPSPLDPGIRKMIETAIAKGDGATVTSVIATARQAAPEGKAEIDALEQGWRDQLAARSAEDKEARLAALREATVLQNWKGEIELGASRATGTTENFGLIGALNLKREGVDWTNQLTARAEVQSTNSQTSTERIIAAWQPNYRFGARTYAYGLSQYEHDPFAGYDNRYTLGGGLGFRAFDSARLKLLLEGGPALRRVDEFDGGSVHSRIAARGSLSLDWRITPTLSLTQKTALYVEGEDGNIVSNTALDTRLIGNLKARFSYDVQYERNPALGASGLNTQSRATFVYGF
jgi:putative salt-induced outer membrane protein